MSRGGRDAGDGLLIFLGVLLGIAFYGPILAAQLSISILLIVKILAPIVGIVAGAVFVAILVKRYWSQY